MQISQINPRLTRTFMKALLQICGLLLLIVSVSTQVTAGKLYKWVDADGNISYQDTPPPNNAKVLEESTINSSGTVAAQTEPAEAVPVVVYTVDDCDSCEMLLLRLRQLEVPFSEESLLNKDIQAEILSIGEAIAAPALKVGSRYVNDFTDSTLIRTLQEAGVPTKVEAPAPDADADADDAEQADLDQDSSGS